jgi:hypothetical protein
LSLRYGEGSCHISLAIDLYRKESLRSFGRFRTDNRKPVVLAVLIIALASVTSAANYMYEKSSAKGTGYKNDELIISTQIGFNGSKLVEKGIWKRKHNHGQN